MRKIDIDKSHHSAIIVHEVINMTRGKAWTKEEKEELNRVANQRLDNDLLLARFPSRTLKGIRDAAWKNGLSRLQVQNKIKATTFVVSESEAAYIAGLFDGEGCLYLLCEKRKWAKRSTWYVRPQISIANTYKPVLDFVENKFGGKIKSCKPQKEYHKMVHSWTLVKMSDALAFLEVILPYLQIKKKQAQELINILRSHDFNLDWKDAEVQKCLAYKSRWRRSRPFAALQK